MISDITVYENSHTYQKTLLFRNELFNVFQINWSKNSETPIHCQPHNGYLLKVISGCLKEIVYNNKEIINIHTQNDISYIDDNIGKQKIIEVEDTISLHIYSSPKFYD